ncbi:hypothetical protein HMI54_008509 [Coelomomyces lativittatus]|nr:hypothetical protein HMI56_006951 [Coelomomyces lativittatus]KAJ1516700.1 hypothetical protein HMI54_008509 [Coelomomyces lativittatus]KAJ1517463.1 hypothetical protein HMI55_006997 [Coelomomyces lativittatus]
MAEQQEQPLGGPSQSQSIHSYSSINGSSRGSSVKGPTSALTSFLHEHGISAREIARRHEAFLQEREQSLLATQATLASTTTETESISVTVQKRRRPKKRFVSSDEESDSDLPAFPLPSSSSSRPVDKEVTPTLQPLCNRCNQPLPLTLVCTCKKQRKPRMKPMDLDRDTSSDAVSSLQDLCVKQIVQYVDAIEHLGDLPTSSRTKLAKALSKRRMLTESVLPMFLAYHLTSLTLFDVTQLSSEVLMTLPQQSPLLHHLHLGFCGRVNDEVMESWLGWHCLNELYLSGIYLITDRVWARFFKERGDKLQKLELTHPSKLSEIGIQALVEAQKSMGFPLNHLSLLHSDSLVASCFQHLASLRLTTLDLRHSCTSLTLDLLIPCLSPTLRSLALTQVTDQTPLLFPSHLQLTECTWTDMHVPITQYPSWTLHTLHLDRSTLMTCPTWFHTSKHTLTSLSIQSWPLSTSMIEAIAACHQLRHLDVSWVREVTDTILERWIQPQLQRVLVFGCHLITPVLVKKGLVNQSGQKIQLIGSEYDA